MGRMIDPPYVNNMVPKARENPSKSTGSCGTSAMSYDTGWERVAAISKIEDRAVATVAPTATCLKDEI